MSAAYFQLVSVSKASGWDDLVALLDEAFDPTEVVAALRAGIGPACERVLIESSYNDKDYRSTYYNFYAKKGYKYEINCVRLHFFDSQVELLSGLELRFKRSNRNESYFGYMVLRPTRLNTIGRTVLMPKLMHDFQGSVIQHEHKVHLLGHRLEV